MFISFIYNAIEGIVVGLISLPFVIVIHELGHLLFGRVSGYQFISLRLLLFQWTKDENHQLKFTRVTSLLGIGGQCLMKPLHEEEEFTYKLYNLGGSLLNLVTGLLLMAPLFLFGQTFTRWLFIAGVVSVFMAIANLIPSSSGGLPNDGSNVKEANKSEDAKRGFYVMLKANGEMALGKKLSELDEELFKVKEEADINNYFVAFTILLYASYLEEMGRYQESYEQLLRIESATLPSIYKAQGLLALLFNELIYQGDDKGRELAKERWTASEKDKDTISIIETIKHPGFLIPYAAKVAILDDDIATASQLASEAKKLIPTLQNPGTEYLAQQNLNHLLQKLPGITLKKGSEDKTKKENSKKIKKEDTDKRKPEKTKEEAIKAMEKPLEEKVPPSPIVTLKEKPSPPPIAATKEKPSLTPVAVSEEKTSPTSIIQKEKPYFPPPVIHPEEKLYVPPASPKVEVKPYVPSKTAKENPYAPLEVAKENPYAPLEIAKENPYAPLEVVKEKPDIPSATSKIGETATLTPAQIIENITSQVLSEISKETEESTSFETREHNFEDIINQFKNRS